MGLFSIFLVGAAAPRRDGTIRKGRRFFRLLPKSWVLVWKGRKCFIFQRGLTDTLSARLPARRFLRAIFLAMKRSVRHHFQFELWACDIFDAATVKQQPATPRRR
jgi:hypothetical protein